MVTQESFLDRQISVKAIIRAIIRTIIRAIIRIIIRIIIRTIIRDINFLYFLLYQKKHAIIRLREKTLTKLLIFLDFLNIFSLKQ